MSLRKDFRQLFIAGISLLALVIALSAPLNGTWPQQQRDRRVAAEPTPTATTPPATTPENSRSIKPSTNAPRTLAGLRSRIEQIAHQPALEPGFFAVKIVSLDTGSVIYEQDAKNPGSSAG